MKYQVAIATARDSKLKTGPAFISVKFKDDEEASPAAAIAKAVKTNMGKHCTVSIKAPGVVLGVEVPAVVMDRYGTESAYKVTVTAA